MKKEYRFVRADSTRVQSEIDRMIEDDWEIHTMNSYGDYGSVNLLFVRQVPGHQDVL